MAIIESGTRKRAFGPRPLPPLVLREIHGSFIDETIAIVARSPRDVVSFAVGSPAREALALAGVSQLAERVLARDGASALGYQITEGDPELREVVAAEARTAGIATDAERVLISAGALQAIDLACRVFVHPGDVAVVESPGFTNALSALRNHGARVLEAPVDEDGLDVEAAARIIRETGVRPRLFFVVPNFQNPTGATLSLPRRQALLALAAEHEAVVVEDDPYRLLRYRGDDLPSLAALADGVRVVHVGSFSKFFLPGIRVGWCIADLEVIRRMAAAKQTMDSSTSSLGQRLALEFSRGDVAAHLGALRTLYAAKQERALESLARHFEATGLSWNVPSGGFYLWVRLPPHVAARELLDAALEEGAAFVPGDAFGVARDHSRGLRFSYSGAPLDRIDEGVRRLRRAFDGVSARG